MCYIYNVFRAWLLLRQFRRYKQAKIISQNKTLKPSLWIKLDNLWLKYCPSCLGGLNVEKTKKFLSKGKLGLLLLKLKTEKTLENYLLKSIIGFIGGMILTYLFFAFFVLQLSFSFATATVMCSILGVILTLGLAFSRRVRCSVLMLLPQFFSKQGRQALTAYAFILALTGPAKNMLHNSGVLSESLACGQDQLRTTMHEVIDLIKKPFHAMKNSIKHIINKVKEVTKKVNKIFTSIKRTVLSIVSVIKDAYDWLNSVISICNKKVGTPFQRCMNVFDSAIADCKVQLSPIFNWMCSITYVAQTLCYTVKFLDYICEFFDFVSDEIVNAVKRKIKEFSHHIRNIFYVSVEFSHSYVLDTEQSKTAHEIATGMVTEIRQRMDIFLTFFDWMSFVFSLFFLFMIYQVLRYRIKFLTNDWFDNKFITSDFKKIDFKRTLSNKESILPLNHLENRKYIAMSSWRLVKSERRQLIRSAIFLLIITIKLSIHILADYCLFWILITIRIHGRFKSKIDVPGTVDIKLSKDGGFISNLYLAIAKTFQPLGLKLEMDSLPCLPDPTPPDFLRYKQIISLIVTTWFLLITEPYGLRLRNLVMSYYHPDIAQRRSVWLYNHILRSRGNFLKYARRQLRKMFSKQNSDIERVSLLDRIMALCPVLYRYFGNQQIFACLLCGTVGTEQEPLLVCQNPGCVGKFCGDCFNHLENICTICMEPIDYGDYSDISEERDSSESENIQSKPRKKFKKKVRSPSGSEKSLITDKTENTNPLTYTYQDEDRRSVDRRPTVHTNLNEEFRKSQLKPELVSLDIFEEKNEADNAELNEIFIENKQKETLTNNDHDNSIQSSSRKKSLKIRQSFSEEKAKLVKSIQSFKNKLKNIKPKMKSRKKSDTIDLTEMLRKRNSVSQSSEDDSKSIMNQECIPLINQDLLDDDNKIMDNETVLESLSNLKDFEMINEWAHTGYYYPLNFPEQSNYKETFMDIDNSSTTSNDIATVTEYSISCLNKNKENCCDTERLSINSDLPEDSR